MLSKRNNIVPVARVSPLKPAAKKDSETKDLPEFCSVLLKLLETEPDRTHTVWADHCGIDRHILSKLLKGKIPVGHKTVAKIALGFPHEQGRLLVQAFLYDEALAIQAAAHDYNRLRNQAFVTDHEELSEAAQAAMKDFAKKHPYPRSALTSEFQAELLGFLSRAKTRPELLERFLSSLKQITE